MAIEVIPLEPTSKTVLKPGEAVIAVKATAAGSRISELSSAYPVKIISPRSSHDRRAVLAFILSYGGGIVPGDKVTIEVEVDCGCRLGLLTQGSTKLYKSLDPNLVSFQTLIATVQDGAALLMLPDPLQPFRDSVYEQRQVFRVHPNANLILLDWISEGRRAVGQVWDLTSLKSLNEVWRLHDAHHPLSTPSKAKSRLLIRDHVILHASRPELLGSVRQQAGGLGIIGTLIVGGPALEKLCHFLLGEFAALPRIGEINWAGDDDDDGNRPAEDGSDLSGARPPSEATPWSSLAPGTWIARGAGCAGCWRGRGRWFGNLDLDFSCACKIDKRVYL